MSDRLPTPLAEQGVPAGAERASATPVWLRPAQGAAAAQPAAAVARPRDLEGLQAWLLAAICDPGAPNPAGMVIDSPRLSGAERLALYRHGYVARLIECLRDDYPVLAQTLGPERFEKLCQVYVTQYPSRSPSLNAFGRHMAEHCRSAIGPFHAELAALEWALVEVTHAEAPPPLPAEALQRIAPADWERAQLHGSDALRVLCFEHPVNTHFQACRAEGRVLPLPERAPSATAVYRRGVELWRMDLTPAMTRVLQAILRGEALGVALSRLYVDEQDPAAVAEAERSVLTWFQAWVQCGFFRDVTLP